MKAKKSFQPGHKDPMGRKYSEGLSKKPICFKPDETDLEDLKLKVIDTDLLQYFVI